jgi:hypothetical protein
MGSACSVVNARLDFVTSSGHHQKADLVEGGEHASSAVDRVQRALERILPWREGHLSQRRYEAEPFSLHVDDLGVDAAWAHALHRYARREPEARITVTY